MDKNLYPETSTSEKPFELIKGSLDNGLKTVYSPEASASEDSVATGDRLPATGAVLSTKHDPNFWANNEHVKIITEPKQRPFIEADMAVAQQIWMEHFERINFSARGTLNHGTVGWTDPEGNDWEFDHDGQHNLLDARVMYEDDGMEGGDLDIDLLDHLSETETKEAETLWAQYIAQNPDVKEASIELKGDDGRSYLITVDAQGNVLHARRSTGRPSINLEEQPAITQSQLYRETLASGHQDAEAQIVRNEIGLAIQILRNILVELRSDVTEVSAAAQGSVTTGEILNTYFHELLEYKGQLDAGKNTTEDQDRRAFFVMSVIAFYKTQRDFMKNPAQNQLPAHMRHLRRR